MTETLIVELNAQDAEGDGGVIIIFDTDTETLYQFSFDYGGTLGAVEACDCRKSELVWVNADHMEFDEDNEEFWEKLTDLATSEPDAKVKMTYEDIDDPKLDKAIADVVEKYKKYGTPEFNAG